jgi:signal peptidase I
VGQPTSSNGRPGALAIALCGGVLAAVMSLAPAGLAGSSPKAPSLSMASSVGAVLQAGSCRVEPSGRQVVATGRTARPTTGRLALTLDVYSAESSPLDLEGGVHSSTLAVGARRWQVSAAITAGYTPTRCVVHVTSAETLERLNVVGASMAPTIPSGSSVLVDLSAYPSTHPQPGDVVALHPPPGAACVGPKPRVLVLRVIAIPGQTIGAAEGTVQVDGHKPAQPWLPRGSSGQTRAFATLTVPNGDYFVLGDDRRDACDSRNFGPVPGSDLVGKAVKVIAAHSATPTTSRYGRDTTPSFTT